MWISGGISHIACAILCSCRRRRHFLQEIFGMSSCSPRRTGGESRRRGRQRMAQKGEACATLLRRLDVGSFLGLCLIEPQLTPWLFDWGCSNFAESCQFFLGPRSEVSPMTTEDWSSYFSNGVNIAAVSLFHLQNGSLLGGSAQFVRHCKKLNETSSKNC